jgi:ubiquinone/menaquinone biosynthesis C-methylase UbiE
MYSEWADALNAQLYEQYAQTYFIYRETARNLVELADIRPGMTAVDLACGTGIVTEQLLSLLTDTGTIIAVDQSAAMLAVAQQKFSTRIVRLIHSSAETIDELFPEGSVDNATSNLRNATLLARNPLHAWAICENC